MLNFIFRYLTFRTQPDELKNLQWSHLIVGLLGTWIVGIGRYWDHPDAELLQHLGVGSLVYVFCLAAVFWLIIKALNVPPCRYFDLLTMICLTSFPAILYAIPVERFMSLSAAATLNVWFLLIVAVWRVSLFATYLHRLYQLPGGVTLLIMLLPLMGIVASLAFLNLEGAVFQIMAGLHGPEPTSNDGAYMVVMLLTGLSYFGVIPVVIIYLFTAVFRWSRSIVKEE